MEIYVKVDNYRLPDSYPVSGPEDFAKKEAALKLLYPTGAIFFVEANKKKWPFIAGDLYSVVEPKIQKKKHQV